MKKLIRNPEKFDVLELFSSMAIKHGYELSDPIAQKDFIKRVQISFENSKKCNISIFGKRIESLFAYVVGALGEVQLIKQEDSGDIYFVGDEILPPDYRLTLNNGTQLLVEVKNCHNDNFCIKKSYYKKLHKYAESNKTNLNFAIYFSEWNIWSLLSIDAFDENVDSYTINFKTAMAKSEMSLLGDAMLGTTPDLELHFYTNSNEASEIDESGQALFTIRSSKILCAGHEVTDEIEQRIAFYLMIHGEWPEKNTEAIVKENKLQGMKFIFSPTQRTKQNFEFIGLLSTMISNGFKEHTIKNGVVVSLNLCIDPSKFQVFIPANYQGVQLPLWQFKIQSNPDFESVIGGELK